MGTARASRRTLLAGTLIWIPAILLAAQFAPARGVEAPVAPREVVLDGNLREWGVAGTVPLDPGGAEIGLRGVFRDADDHQADVYVMWSATHLYVAAAVRDDSLDARAVPPEEREYASARGRKDRMFYYDHFKIFVRGPGENAGTNLWVAPVVREGRAYAWGGRQREGPGTVAPVETASAARYPVYTYEVALPWSWLQIHPAPGMVLDGLLLVTDADRPGAEVRTKVAAGDGKWIWWQGQIALQGQPEGWSSPPPPSEQLDARVQTRAEAQGRGAATTAADPARQARVRQAIERSRALRRAEARQDSARAAAASGTSPPMGSFEAADSVVEAAPSPGAAPGDHAAPRDSVARAAARRYAASMRAVFARSQERPVAAQWPEWIRHVPADSALSAAQVDTCVAVLTRTLARLVRGRTSGRTDYLAIDMARASGAPRPAARRLLTGLMGAYAAQLDTAASPESRRLEAASRAASVPVDDGRALVREVLRRARAVHGDGKATTTGELLRRGRRRADLSQAQAEALLDALFGIR